MNKRISFLNFFALASIACVVFIMVSANSVQAQSIVTFAQFVERTGAQDFAFTNNGTNGVFATASGGAPIYFRYQNIQGLPTSLEGFQDAHLILSVTTTQPATANSGMLSQPFNAVNTIQILRDTPAPVGVGSGTRQNLLTIRFSANPIAPSETGSDGGNSANLSMTTPDNTVTFTSDFLSFNNTTQRNGALSFSSVLPSLTIGAGNFLKSFTAAGSGTFASNPPPTFLVPTAAPTEVSGRVVNSFGSALRRVNIEILDTTTGETRRTQTRGDGSYTFENVQVGRFYIITAWHKSYSFTPSSIAVQVNAQLLGTDFTGQRY